MSNNNDDYNIIVGEEPAVNGWDLGSYKRKEEWEKRKKEWEERQQQKKIDENKNSGILHYRCEQTILNRIDGIITSNAETKRGLKVQILHDDSANTVVNTQIEESHISIRPEKMQPALQLINEVDTIKCCVKLLLDKETGKIGKVLNLPEIKDAWEVRKKELYSKFSSILGGRTKETDNLDKFTQLIDKHLESQESFITDLTSKIFFDVFFDKYLIGKKFENKNYKKIFYSFLFDQKPVGMTLTQKANVDAKTHLYTILNYVSSENQMRKEYNDETFRKIYAQRYQPIIKYNFTNYKFNYDTRTVLGEDGLPDEISVNIMEAVENNVELIVIYKIRRLK